MARPDVCLEAQRALAVWNLCGGYEVQRLPIVDLTLRIDDVEATMLMMAAIRDTLRED